MRYRPIKISCLDGSERQFVYGASRIALCQEEAGAPGRDYLYNQRGLDVETVAQFRLGFVPFFLGHPFAGRVVFPVFDSHDKLIALSVRPIADEPSIQKYWNESFPKGEHLYGLNLAKYHIALMDFVIVVEGQVDVLQLHGNGLRNTVGIMGGSFTPLHAHLLKKWTRNFVFMMDGDDAGDKHAERAKEVLEVYRQVNKSARSSRLCVSCVKLERGEDPASYVMRFGGRKLRAVVSGAMSSVGMRPPERWKR
jgi:DNA primase